MKLPKVTIGKSPTGPLGKTTLSGGGGSRRSQFKTSKSKKGYTGSIAGIGRTPRTSNHPNGPGFARRNPSVSLGPRAKIKESRPAKTRVFKRVANRARAAVFGF